MKYIDISLPINPELTGFPGDPVYTMTRTASHDEDHMVLSNLEMGTHTGTHIDFPLHFIADGKTVDNYNIDKFSGNALVLDFTSIELGNGISTQDFKDKKLENLEGIDFILLKTRNSEIYTKEFNTQFVYLEPDAARYISQFNLKGVGIDYLSIEQYGFDTPDTHITLLQRDILIIEGLDLIEIDEDEYKFFGFPMNIEGAEGCPVRAVLATTD